ncbi:MAG: DnaJ domain-containing protein [Spongiibacter sp.]|nr:DnaJ domain-containing protein [Spongiibacter sp.]
MIIKLAIAGAVIYALFRFIKYVRSQPPEQRRSYYLTLVISSAAAALVLLSITGRVHWLAGIIGGAMPFVRQFVMRHIYNKLSPGERSESGSTGQGKRPPPSMNMDLAQARSILGVSADASESDIIQAHRSLMQKLHPDRGGNDYLASQINAAKELLLKSVG